MRQPPATLVDCLIIGKGETESGKAISGEYLANLLFGVGVESVTWNKGNLVFHGPIKKRTA